MDPTDDTSSLISILYVEDEREAREVLGSILSKKYPDTNLYLAENGLLGLELFKLHRPDIVITDISMPVMNGIRMSSEIKALKPETVIVALTAFSDTNSQANAIDTGINHYLLKPLDYGVFFSILDRIVCRA